MVIAIPCTLYILALVMVPECATVMQPTVHALTDRPPVVMSWSLLGNVCPVRFCYSMDCVACFCVSHVIRS